MPAVAARERCRDDNGHLLSSGVADVLTILTTTRSDTTGQRRNGTCAAADGYVSGVSNV